MKKSVKILIIILILIILGLLTFIILNNKEDEVIESNINSSNDNFENEKNAISDNTPESSNIIENEVNSENKLSNNTVAGTWIADDNSGELVIENIGNNSITFSWSLYRLTSITDVTVPLANNKATFYYQGWDDTNFNGINDDGEHYTRKVTLELGDQDITITIEDCSAEELSENIDLDKTSLFSGGQVYIETKEYAFSDKR